MADKVAYTFDPFKLAGKDPPSGRLREARKRICELVLESVLDSVGKGSSPVSGGAWKKSLSPEYKKKKSEFSSALFANMELHGDMLDALECVPVSGGKLELRIQGRQAAKADGHNNFSGQSSLPLREFIPKPDQTFKRQIISQIREVIDDLAEE